MCGITGIFDTRGKRDIDRAVLDRMNEAQFHRGPDEGGTHVEPGVGLGHRRLSIIDWNEVAAGALDDQDPPVSSLTEDSIHPTADGNTELNQLYASALSGCR